MFSMAMFILRNIYVHELKRNGPPAPALLHTGRHPRPDALLIGKLRRGFKATVRLAGLTGLIRTLR